MKKTAALLLSVLALLAVLSPAGRAAHTAAPTPVDEARLLFSKKLGAGYRNAPTPVAVSGNALYLAAGGNFYKLDAATGETLAQAPLASVSTYTAVPPTVAGNTVYMPLDDGVVQAFDADTLETIWTYTDPLGGQGLTPVVFDDGRLYTGSWNGETDEADFVCLPAAGSGEQTALWRFSAPGGFYRAEALILDDFILFGSDNGERVNLPEAPGTVRCLDKTTGALCGSLALPGDIRAGIGLDPDTGDCCAASKAGALCRFSADAETGALTKRAEIRLPGGMTVTPEIRAGRLYAACADSGKGRFLVLEADTLQTVYTAELPGVPQGNLLVSGAYPEKTCIYTTCNTPPGGIWLMTDAPGQTAPDARAFFSPPQEAAQYCFCPIAAGEDGALYYKNDSGTVFAVAGNETAKSPLRTFLAFCQRLIDLLGRLLKGWWRAA